MHMTPGQSALLAVALLTTPLAVLAIDGVHQNRVGDRILALLGSDGELPSSFAEEELPAAKIIVVTRERISMDGLEIRLVDGQVAGDDLRGLLIKKLYEALLDQRFDNEGLAALTAGAYREEHVVLAVDKSVPFETLRAVMYTGGQAQVTHFTYAVANPWMGLRGTTTDLPQTCPPEEVGDDAQPEQPPTHSGIHIHPQGLVFSSTLLEETLPCDKPCTLDSYDWNGLSTAVAALKDRAPHEVDVTVTSELNVSMEVLVRTLDVARHAPLVDLQAEEPVWTAWRASRRTLLDLPVVAGVFR